MPIPQLVNGWLPVGEHNCTLDEIEARFATDQHNNERREIFAALRRYLRQPLVQRHCDHYYVDGSFASAKETPSDVDLLVGIHPMRWKPLVFNQPGMSPNDVLRRLQGGGSIVAGKRLVHAFPFPIGSAGYRDIHAHFQQSDRADEPDEKGVLKVGI